MTTVTTINAGRLSDGREIHRFVIANEQIEVSLLDFGVRLTSVKLAGLPQNLVLAYPSLPDYEQDTASMGAVVGRYANRIRDARFELDGHTVRLSANRGRYHLHGGFNGFARQKWEGRAVSGGVVFSLVSNAGDEGYPGKLQVWLEVRLTEDALVYRYEATSDADTVINLTNHAYFNLSDEQDILTHRLQLFADDYLPVDDELLPTGEIVPVAGTPLDFREEKTLGRDMTMDDEQIRIAQGFDHCFVLRGHQGDDTVAPAARLSAGNVVMSVHTTEPGIQLYTGNHLPHRFRGVCLETQHFPDSPNQRLFPSTVLRAGKTYRSITRYQFEVNK